MTVSRMGICPAVSLQWPALACAGGCRYCKQSLIEGKNERIRTYLGLEACRTSSPPFSVVGLHWLSLAVSGLCQPSSAVVGCCGPFLALVSRRWPSLAVIGCCRPSLACVAIVGLRWPSLACVGLRWPALAFDGQFVGQMNTNILYISSIIDKENKNILSK